MKHYILIIVLHLVAISGCSQPADKKTKSISAADTKISGVLPFGSGWDDLLDTNINYFYHDFSGFNLTWHANGDTTWQGYEGGGFEGITRRQPTIASKVSDGIYFSSWPSPMGGGDNVVHNMNEKTVNAHLGSPDNEVILIWGKVDCWNQSSCVVPTGEITSMDVIGDIRTANLERYNLPSVFALRDPGRTLSTQDQTARSELSGKAIVFQTREGITRIEVNGNKMSISEAGSESRIQRTIATKITDGIYFLSWEGPHGGNHLVFNTITQKVYDHLLHNGERQEQIFPITCMAIAAEC